jgi:hypothetical protein
MPTDEELANPVLFDRLMTELRKQDEFKMQVARLVAEQAAKHDRAREDVALALRGIAEAITR